MSDFSANRPMTERREMVLTVGQGEGDLQGGDDRVLQAGADYLHRLGGGVLQILPGVYTMRNALYLHPNLTVRGSGSATVLKKAAREWLRLWCGIPIGMKRGSRWRMRSGFGVGCGVMLRSYGKSGMTVVKDTVTAIEGRVISLSKRVYKNMWLDERATLATIFPILTAEEGVCDVND